MPITQSPTTTEAPITTPAPNPWKTQSNYTLTLGSMYRVGSDIMEIITISSDNKNGPDVSMRINDDIVTFDDIGCSYYMDDRNRLVLTDYKKTGNSTGEVIISFESLDLMYISTRMIEYEYHSKASLKRFESVEVDDHIIKLVDASMCKKEYSGIYFSSATFEVDGTNKHISNFDETIFFNEYIKVVLTGGQATSSSNNYEMEIEIYYINDMPKPSISIISWKEIGDVEIYGPKKIKIGNHIVELYNKRYENDPNAMQYQGYKITYLVEDIAINGIERGTVRARETCLFFIGETIMIIGESYVRRTVSSNSEVEYSEIYPVLTFYYLDSIPKPTISLLSATR